MKSIIIAVTGGKGGAGKSTIAVNLAVELANEMRVLLIDADVDNPNDSTLLGVKTIKVSDITSFAPEIDQFKCIRCGSCVKVCPEHALVMRSGNPPIVFVDRCSGCRACYIVCEAGAISDRGKILGEIFEAETEGLKLIGAKIRIGEARSPIVVKQLMNYVDGIIDGFEIAIIDTAPGIQNTVIQALMKSKYALVVTEPTPLGLYTLKLMTRALEKLVLPRSLIINRSNIPSSIKSEVESYAKNFGFEEIFEVPYDESFIAASIEGRPAVKAYPLAAGSKAIRGIAEFIKQFFNEV